MRLARVTNRTSGVVVGEAIQIANNSITRFWGLLGRSGISAGGGLWIKPSSGVHTIGMKFPIDVIGLDKNMSVVRLWENLRPFRATSVSFKVASVIELAAGRVSECAIKIGDSMEIAAHR